MENFGHFPKAIDSKVDVWSFGVTLFELTHDGQEPYTDLVLRENSMQAVC